MKKERSLAGEQSTSTSTSTSTSGAAGARARAEGSEPEQRREVNMEERAHDREDLVLQAGEDVLVLGAVPVELRHVAIEVGVTVGRPRAANAYQQGGDAASADHRGRDSRVEMRRVWTIHRDGRC